MEIEGKALYGGKLRRQIKENLRISPSFLGDSMYMYVGSTDRVAAQAYTAVGRVRRSAGRDARPLPGAGGPCAIEAPLEGGEALPLGMRKALQPRVPIDAQNPYEFIRCLSMMLRNPMNLYVFPASKY